MKSWFRPMPGLTVVSVICLAILISLGMWQYHRLQWKTALLADIDAVAEAPPFTSFSEIQAALKQGKPIDFRRIGLTAEHVDMQRPPFFVFTSENRDISWRIFRPVRDQRLTVFAALNVVSDQERSTVPMRVEGEIAITGYVRLVRDKRGKRAKSSPDKNRWFAFNPLPETHNWADEVIGPVETRFYIDVVGAGVSADNLPPKRPDIRNNHFDYMLTWFGLAITLLVIYLIMHKRTGRFGRL